MTGLLQCTRHVMQTTYLRVCIRNKVSAMFRVIAFRELHSDFRGRVSAPLTT